MKAIRIIVPEAHDGLGGVHHEGDVISLPADVTAIFIERGVAVEATEVDAKQAKALAAKREDDQRAAELEGSAKARMRGFDELPKEVRDTLNENDGSVHAALVEHLAVDEEAEFDGIEDGDPEPETPRPRRGRRRSTSE